MDLVACLLPAGLPLHLETWSLDETAAQLTLRLTATQTLVHCPVCRFPTQRIHSHYTRTVADLPWAHLHVVLQLGVRKFFCANGRCTRSIFTERLPQLLAPWARRTQRPALDAVNAAMRQQPVSLPDGTVAVPVPPPATPPRAQQQAAQRAAQRQATYEQVWALHRQGWTVPVIAAQVGHSRHTIERYLRLPTWPVPQHRSTYGRSVLNPYKVFLLERWNAGCRTAMQLFRELQPRGYTGSYRRVAAYASRLRQAQGLPPRRQGRRQTLPVVAEPASPPLTPRRATWLVLGREDKRAAAETQQLAQLHAQDPAVAEAIDLAQDFTTLVRQRQPERLDPWLQRAATSTLEALQRFATGLYEDYNAVKAGVTMPWSNGPVEGHINRLKMLKRQMFGRAHLDLLSRRFLLAPRRGPGREPRPQAAAAARAPPAAA